MALPSEILAASAWLAVLVVCPQMPPSLDITLSRRDRLAGLRRRLPTGNLGLLTP